MHVTPFARNFDSFLKNCFFAFLIFNFFENDNDEMVIEETEDDNDNITVVAWDDFRHYNERNYPPAMILRRNKSDQTINV